jgi:hypothetical protein
VQPCKKRNAFVALRRIFSTILQFVCPDFFHAPFVVVFKGVFGVGGGGWLVRAAKQHKNNIRTNSYNVNILWLYFKAARPKPSVPCVTGQRGGMGRHFPRAPCP